MPDASGRPARAGGGRRRPNGRAACRAVITGAVVGRGGPPWLPRDRGRAGTPMTGAIGGEASDGPSDPVVGAT